MYNITSKKWSDGTQAIKLAWNTYKEQIGFWILIYLTIGGITMFCSLIPYIGSILSSFAGLILSGVFVGIIHNYVHHKKEPSSDIVTKIIDEHMNDFIKLAAIGTGFWFGFGFFFGIIIMGIFLSTVGLQGFLSSSSNIERTLEHLFFDETFSIIILGSIFFMLMIFLIVAALYFMAFVFAPYLIVVEKEDVVRSLKMSFLACQENLWSLTSISLYWLVLTLVGILTCCLGMLVVGPIITLSTYHLASMIFVRIDSLSLDKE